MDHSKRGVGDDEIRFDILKLLDDHWWSIARITLAVTALVALLAFAYLVWWQPTTRTAVLEFQPTFAGASAGRYPNGLPFGPADVTASSVLDQVFETNGIERFCSRDAFKTAFFIDQQSTAYAPLEAELQARLADARLSTVDRDRILQDYDSRRQSIPLQYRLVFAHSEECESVPRELVTKSLTEVLSVWAQQSEARRGVLKLQVQILTPNLLEVGLQDEASRLIRADLLRTGLRRLVNNVRTVEELPGASLVRLGEQNLTFAEVRSKLEDLLESRLGPLVVMAGRGVGAEASSWIDEALASATQERAAAEGKVERFVRGLREYSGRPQASEPSTPAAEPLRSTDAQTLTPQIDRSFVDRLLQMSAEDTRFRQEMTRAMVDADAEAVESRAKERYYGHLATALRRPGGGALPGDEVDKRLGEIVRDGKALAQQFSALYDEWSAVALRPAPALFRTYSSVRFLVSRPFTSRSFVLTVGIAFLATLLITAAIFFLLSQLRRSRNNRVVSPS
ncbi:MAG: hypothetical protein M3R55_03380 [Acidobacteriota bacterium]|nr:hypothetical protein [Acidobacteriota bacterium]